MKIAHVCLSCFFIDGRSYQENELVREHVDQGHDVLVIASTETHDAAGQLTYVKPSDYIGVEGARVVRLPYANLMPSGIARKLRIHPAFASHLSQFAPDAILFHGTCGWELLTAARYAKTHPHTLFYVDSHEDWHNSARTWLSREVLHRFYYGSILRRALPAIRQILCVSTEAMEFVRDVYRVPWEHLEFYPLGGRLPTDEEYTRRRTTTRQKYAISSEQKLLVQSGKQTKRKRLLDTLACFKEVNDPSLRLFVAGVLHSDIREQATQLIEGDQRVQFLGWQDAEALTNLLCAADVYVQPGTQSVTMQHSLCCRCAIIIDDARAHQVYLRENGWLVRDRQTLRDALDAVSDSDLAVMSSNSHKVAAEMLDYNLLSQRILR